MPRRRKAIKIILLFLATLGILQSGIFGRIALANDWLQPLAFLAIICISFIVMESEESSHRDYGFVMPRGIGRHLALPILFAVSYVFVLIFLPGISLAEFEAFPSPSLSLQSLLTTITILFGAVATEMTFRGYIQTNLSKDHGFVTGIIASSIASVIFMLPIPFYTEVDSTMLFRNAVTLLAEGVFLSLLLRKTGTLLSPIAYSASVAFLYTFTPLKATSNDYAILVMTLPYVFFILIIELFVSRIDEAETSPIVESSDPQFDKDTSAAICRRTTPDTDSWNLIQDGASNTRLGDGSYGEMNQQGFILRNGYD